jgi:NADH-ubiquinone oxidoreductase B18 subunit (NDUFB7)
MYLPFGEASVGSELKYITSMPSSTTASQTELKAARVPIAWRDQCSACVSFYNAHQNINDTDVYRFCLDPFTCTIKGYSSR